MRHGLRNDSAPEPRARRDKHCGLPGGVHCGFGLRSVSNMQRVREGSLCVRGRRVLRRLPGWGAPACDQGNRVPPLSCRHLRGREWNGSLHFLPRENRDRRLVADRQNVSGRVRMHPRVPDQHSPRAPSLRGVLQDMFRRALLQRQPISVMLRVPSSLPGPRAAGGARGQEASLERVRVLPRVSASCGSLPAMPAWNLQGKRE
mmetsp:Transcript_14321/g.34652  ORF Transcript_14321/g.34652 Transcript_14321/m.34652 type:complete len:203 (+) Transcript_14321:563-1171(+)